jgi:hypothetical protein
MFVPLQLMTLVPPAVIEALLAVRTQAGVGGFVLVVTDAEHCAVPPGPVTVPVNVVFDARLPVLTEPPATGVTEPIP